MVDRTPRPHRFEVVRGAVLAVHVWIDPSESEAAGLGPGDAIEIHEFVDGKELTVRGLITNVTGSFTCRIVPSTFLFKDPGSPHIGYGQIDLPERIREDLIRG